MKYLIPAVFAFLFTACEKKGNDRTVYNATMEIEVFDSAGNDLLDINNITDFNSIGKIKIFYLINGKIEEVYHANYDHPRNFFIYQADSNYRMRLFVNDRASGKYPVTYLQWNEDDTDTIKAYFKREENYTSLRKAWYNGEEVSGGMVVGLIK